jgi:hypothetical protein
MAYNVAEAVSFRKKICYNILLMRILKKGVAHEAGMADD